MRSRSERDTNRASSRTTRSRTQATRVRTSDRPHEPKSDRPRGRRSDQTRRRANDQERRPKTARSRTSNARPRLLYVIAASLVVLMLAAGAYAGVQALQNLLRPTEPIYPAHRLTVELKETTQLDVTTQAASSLVATIDGSECFYTLNADALQVAPASLTKLYTIAYAATLIGIDDTLDINQSALNLAPEGSSLAHIPAGTYTARDLYAAMLLPSGNDAANALAASLGRRLAQENQESVSSDTDAVAYFVAHMNDWLTNQDMSTTHLVDPAGFEASNTTTARDVLAVVVQLESYEWFRELSAHSSYTTHDTMLITSNKLMQPDSVWYSPQVNGIKTGTLPDVYNLAFSYDTRTSKGTVIGVILGAPSDEERYSTAAALIKQLDAALAQAD